MVERWIVEYAVNCAWQIPLLAAGAWLLVKVMRPGALTQHCLWLAVLALAVALPGRGVYERPIAKWGSTRNSPTTLTPATPQQNRVGEPLTARALRTAKYIPPVEEESVPLPVAGRNLVLNATATWGLVALYVLAIFIGGLRLVRGLLAARRLALRSREAVLSPRTRRVLEESCLRLKVAMPRIQESGEIDGPVILRAMRPVMVLPPGFEAHEEEEVRAALLHELAHVRRRDYLVNLVCQIAALPVVWHPAVYGIQQRIRRTREMVCDAMAAEEMESGAEYARCLMSLARQMVNGASFRVETQAMGLFENNTMEERVMHLTDATVVMSGRARVLRGLCGCAAMALVAGVAVTFHVRPTFAAAEAVVQSVGPAPAAAPVALAKPSARFAASDDAPLAIARGHHAKVTGEKGDHVHRWKGADGEPFAMVNHDAKEPSFEEKRRIERQFEDAKKEADEATKWANGLEFQGQMAELQKSLNSAEMKKQIEAANRVANDPAMKLRMEELQKSLSRLDALPELKKFNDPEWQKEFAELQKNAPDFKFNFDFDKQMALANESAMEEAKLNETIAKAMKGKDEQMAKLQKELETGELKQELEEATRLLEEVQRKMEKMQSR